MAAYPSAPYSWPSLAELVQRSRHIVAGTVVNTNASWTAARREIVTTVTLTVERRLKGAADVGVVQFQYLGGTVGNVRLEVTHTPRFETGETVLVFLGDRAAGLPTVVGAEAGKHRVRPDDDGTWRLLPPLLGPPAIAAGSAPILTVGDLAAALPRLEAARIQAPEAAKTPY